MISSADDTRLIVHSKDSTSLYRHASESITKVAEWMRVNDLALNRSKTKYMRFGYASNDDQEHRVVLHVQNCKHEYCDCTEILRTSYYKYLGLFIQDNLKNGMHISQVISKVRSGVAILYKPDTMGYQLVSLKS